MKEALLFFFVQAANYGLVVLNTRAISTGSYGKLIVSDIMLSMTFFFLVKRLSDRKDSYAQMIGYVTGSVAGGVLGLWLSTRL